MSYETFRRPLAPVVRAAYRVQVRGLEHVPEDGPLVVTGNHESILDPLFLSAAIARPIRYLGKSELWSVPLLPWLLASVEAIPIERGKSDGIAMAAAVAALEAGEVVGLFPEGGVMREGLWLRGAARMALATGTPLLPVRLLETRKALGKTSFGFPRVAVLVGEPIVVDRTTPTPELARTLTDRLQSAVMALGT